MRILDVGPWIAYPPERGSAVRAFTLLRELATRHDVRQFGRGSARLRPGQRLLQEVPVTPMFRVYRCRYPFGSAATEWLSAREDASGVTGSLARRLACPPRLRELLAWAHVVLAEDPHELALCRREHPGGRYVFVAHGVGDPSSVSRTGHDRLAEAVASAELTIASNVADRDELIRRYGLPAGRVLEVRSAVDTDRYQPVDDAGRARRRHELGLPEGPLVVFVASATAANRAGLAWVRRLAAADPSTTYVVVGSVGEPERRGNLIVTGRVGDVAPYLQSADAAVCPVEHGSGTRIKLLEALATGLPCVMFAEGLRGTALADGLHVVVAGKSEPELLAALAGLLADPAASERLGRAGRAHVVERHGARASASVLEEALLDLLDARPRTGARGAGGASG